MALSDTVGLLFRINADGDQAVREMNRVRGAEKDMEGSTKSLANAFSVFAGNIAAGALQGLTTELIQGTKALIDYSARLEQTEVSFSTLMGSTVLAKEHLEDLKKLSLGTGLEFQSLTKMSQRLQGAGVEAGRVRGLIEDIGNTAAATGELTAERLEGIGTAISQVFAKGIVSAEEMEQLAERGIPAWRILAEAIGKPISETRKLAEEGKITSEQFLSAFSRFTEMNFGDAMAKQADTFSGAMARITNLLQVVGSEAFKPIFESISGFATAVGKSLSEQQAEAKDHAITFGNVVGTAIGVGIANSGLGTRSFWEQILFIGVDIGKAADKWGKDVAKSARAGFLSAQPLSDEEQFAKDFQTAADNYENAVKNFIKAQEATRTKQKGLSDEEKKKAAAAAEADAKALVQIYENQLRQLEKSFDDSFKKLKDKLKDTGDIPGFLQSFAGLYGTFSAQVEKIVPKLEAVENRIAQTAGERANQATLREQEQQRRKTELATKGADAIAAKDKAVTDTQKTISDKQLQNAKERYEYETAYFQAEANKRVAVASEYAKVLGKTEADLAKYRESLELDALRNRKEQLQKYQALLVSGSQEYGRVADQILILEEDIEAKRATNAANQTKRDDAEVEGRERVIRKIWEMFEAQKKKDEQDKEKADREAERTRARRLGELGLQAPKEGELFGSILESATTLIPEGEEFTARSQAIAAGFGAIDQAARGVAEAVGSMVESWVLYGGIGGSIQKVTAQIIAGIAKQATVQAVWELAQGLAMLAQNFFWPDPKLAASAALHFQSVAVYGGIAGIAAIAGRAVAGNSFNQGTAGATGNAQGMQMQTGASRSATYGAYSGQKESLTIDASRNAPAATIVIKDSTGMMGKLLEWEIDTNSRVRSLIVETASA